MLSQEPHTPYDRPVLSKNLNASINKIQLRSQEFLLDEADVELFLDTKAVSVDVNTKTIKTDKGKTYTCDKVSGGFRNVLCLGLSMGVVCLVCLDSHCYWRNSKALGNPRNSDEKC